jgi:hypothetical protein
MDSLPACLPRKPINSVNTLKENSREKHGYVKVLHTHETRKENRLGNTLDLNQTCGEDDVKCSMINRRLAPGTTDVAVLFDKQAPKVKQGSKQATTMSIFYRHLRLIMLAS